MARQGWVRAGAAGVLTLFIAACTGSAVPSSTPTGSPPVAPSPTVLSSSPSPSPAATPVLSIAAASAKPRSSAGPHQSASPDVAALVESYSSYFTATIRVLDLADADLAVSVAYVDPSSPPQDLGTYTVGPSGQESNALPPGTYRLAFRQPPGATTGSSCTVAITQGDIYTFVAVPSVIAVSKVGTTPANATELFLPTSPLCLK